MSDEFSVTAMADEGVAKNVEYTGRYLVLLDQDEPKAGIKALSSGAGVKVTNHVQAGDSAIRALEKGGTVVLDDLGIAIVEAVEGEQRLALEATIASTPALVGAEPERVLHAYKEDTAALQVEYFEGYLHGVADLVERLRGNGQVSPSLARAATGSLWSEEQATWGLQAILATETALTGKGVGVAILDTGINEAHPDLADRVKNTASFVPGQAVEDGHGHGTHCAGTACGPRKPATGPRYGVACEADIYVAKVLNNQGRGSDGQILDGINWAMDQKAVRVISMSLGGAVAVGAGFSRIYERAARRCLNRGKVIVAAAGNESQRPLDLQPVGTPANCPSVLAVGAIAQDFTIAPFSCAGLNPNGGGVDLAGPGVDVLSTWRNSGYRRLSGTSMATPHVAGVAALLWEQNPNATAGQIVTLLRAGTRHLDLSATDAGRGLVQAP
ncbi:S8 family serine peptidase [Streptomyces sp. NBC_00140]|uniref:S8 family peptidase n=1 Tax=Streptomyces sp. NBC_00140 TaxID=2975664 RepID=UPI002255F963|nr:S8 family serine peptidase [Streptomyces sp. NBC_00140]MCX5336560.1 S8 family serine peptidase [Streptomyces sp. NBC_00140]